MRLRGATIVVLAITLLAGCNRQAPVEEASEETRAIAVKAAAPKAGPIADVLAAMGETAATSTVRLSSPIAGRVAYLTAQPGDQASQGEVLARVLSLENEAALAGFAMLRSSPSQGATNPGALEREISARSVAVRSPFAGLVVERLHNAGEQVPQGEALLELFDPRSLVAIAQVPAESASRLSRGMKVDVVGAGFRGNGRVEAVLPALVPGALTVPVRVAFVDPKPTLLLRAAVECRITLAEHERALLIPASALLAPTRGTSGEVLVVSNGKAERKQITVGLRTASEVEVVDGLDAADRVIVGGGYGLPDGTAVTAEDSQDSGDSEDSKDAKRPEGAT